MAQTSPAPASLLAPRGDEIRLPRRVAPAAPVHGSGPMMLMPRRLPGGVAAVLDALPDEALPRLRYEGPAAGLRRALRAALAERLPRPRWLANWLLNDVLDQAALVAELAGGAALRVTLGAGEAEGAFGVAAARLRLVTSYRGAGTEWVAPRFAADVAPGAEPPAAALRHLGRGDVAVLRGGGDVGGPGVLHRAAPGGGLAALRLTVDAAARPRRHAGQRVAPAARALQ